MKSTCILLAVLLAGISTSPSHAENRSWKRGVSANSLTSEQVQLLAPGVSWIYNWGTTPGNIQLNGEMEFLPMIWGNNQSTLDSVKSQLDGGARPSTILVLNEPNLRGQAFITPEASATWIEHVHATLAAYDIPLIGPQMALGSAPADSITAFDPILLTEVTYTSMNQFLDAFDYYLDDGIIDGISVHPYGNSGELKWSVDTAYDRYGQPVWMTEFNYWDVATVEDEYAYLLDVLDFLEHSPKVGRYAWFKADMGNRVTIHNLFTSGGTELSRLGLLYVNFPAHNPEYFYPVPGRIQAEAYSEKENMAMVVAADEAGMGALYNGRQSGWVNYQIAVPQAGTYRLRLRIASEFFSNLPAPNPDPGLPDPPSGIQRDLWFTLDLKAGPQILHLMFKGMNAQLDWFELEPAGP